MPIIDKNRIYDGFDSLEGGVDAGRRANVIGVNQAVSAENAVFRGGLCTSRPGIRKMGQAFLNPDSSCGGDGIYSPITLPGLTALEIFPTAIFQGAAYYSPRGGTEVIMAMLGGRFFRIT